MKFRKKMATLLIAIFMISAMVFVVGAKPKNDYNTITKGEISYSTDHYLAGHPIPTGFDVFGYNYQGHMFDGSYASSYLGKDGFPPYEGDTDAYYARLVSENFFETVTEAEEYMTGYTGEDPNVWYWPHRDVRLMMKWSDVWISNMDRDGDGLLDRGYPTNPIGDPPAYTNSAGEGAWLTNHQSGINDDETHWNYFVKIVHPGEGAEYNSIDKSWYTADGVLIGPAIWGAFARILQISNDPAYDEHGVLNNWPAPAGFGNYK